MKPETDNFNLDDITEARRKAVTESIRPISAEKLKELGDEILPFFDHPWRELYFGFIAENADATFYHATTHDGIQIIYCHAKGKGLWFIPKVGKGMVQPRALAILKEIVDGR